MTESEPKNDDPVAAKVEPAQPPVDQEERLEDEEKILAGRHDVNYPALLTKDVPGG